jgi:hypothetical protein
MKHDLFIFAIGVLTVLFIGDALLFLFGWVTDVSVEVILTAISAIDVTGLCIAGIFLTVYLARRH